MGYVDTQLFINGQWQAPAEGKTLPVLNPATGKEIGRVAHASRPDLDKALQAAQKGFEVWRDMVPAERSKIMRKAAALMRERADTIAPLLTQEQGKPLAEAKVETLAAADIIEWFAEEGFRVYGRIVPSRVNVSIRQMVIKDPVGPVAAFTPWNFPINQVVRKVGAALSAGCSILVKAPEETPAAPAALVGRLEPRWVRSAARWTGVACAAQLAVFAGYSIYFPELFPTRLRGTGVGFCYNTVRYLAAPAPILFGYLTTVMSFRSAAMARKPSSSAFCCWALSDLHPTRALTGSKSKPASSPPRPPPSIPFRSFCQENG